MAQTPSGPAPRRWSTRRSRARRHAPAVRPAPRRRLTVGSAAPAGGRRPCSRRPAVLMVTVFFFVPLALTFYMSLHNWSLLGAHTVDRLRELHARLQRHELSANAFIFTLEYTAVTTPVLFFIGLGLALLPWPPAGAWASRFFQSVYFLPVVHRLRLGELPLPLHGASRGSGRCSTSCCASGSPSEQTGTGSANKWSALLLVVVRRHVEVRRHADAAAARRAADRCRSRSRRPPASTAPRRVAVLPLRDAAAAAADARAGARLLRGWLAAGLRPVLHHDPRRAVERRRSPRSTRSTASRSCSSASATAPRCPSC